MTPPLDARGLCSVCGWRDVHREWCADIAALLAAACPPGRTECTTDVCLTHRPRPRIRDQRRRWAA